MNEETIKIFRFVIIPLAIIGTALYLAYAYFQDKKEDRKHEIDMKREDHKQSLEMAQFQKKKGFAGKLSECIGKATGGFASGAGLL